VDGKKRKRTELVELCKNAAEIRVPKVDKEIAKIRHKHQ